MFFLALLIVIAGWRYTNDVLETTKPSQKTALQENINACDLITEKAAANLVAIVEEQKLEIVGRKAHVFKLCMGDRGYQENPDWTKFSAPIADKVSKETNVSVDEAFENLRRENMMQITPKKGTPLFWRKSGKSVN
jgi:hypothetical protein